MSIPTAVNKRLNEITDIFDITKDNILAILEHQLRCCNGGCALATIKYLSLNCNASAVFPHISRSYLHLVSFETRNSCVYSLLSLEAKVDFNNGFSVSGVSELKINEVHKQNFENL